jgi:hypothetical protein
VPDGVPPGAVEVVVTVDAGAAREHGKHRRRVPPDPPRRGSSGVGWPACSWGAFEMPMGSSAAG